MAGLFKVKQPKPIIPPDQTDEDIQAAARRVRPSSIRAETLLTAGQVPGAMAPAVRRVAMGG